MSYMKNKPGGLVFAGLLMISMLALNERMQAACSFLEQLPTSNASDPDKMRGNNRCNEDNDCEPGSYCSSFGYCERC